MSTSTRITFALHSIIALVFGLPLLIAPGRALDILDWVPIDPILTRMFGAALLALAWGSFRGWRAEEWDKVAYLVELEIIFTVLSAVGIIRHLLIASYPWYIWTILIILLLFAIAWIIALFKK
ncbi:MAG: hypothetical protein BMS9Abin02_2003 [Anaerolineae bacterium]|nr:MAG: hypothetical protein BMS9Abin02_2003 [Anaerolineae bacterium]